MESFTDLIKSFPRMSAGMGYLVGFRDNTLVCVMREGALNDGEIEAIRTGQIKYGVFIRGYIPFILFGFSFGTFEFPVNAYAVFADRGKLLEQYKGLVSFMVYDNNIPRLVAGRSVNLSKGVVRQLKSSLIRQLNQYRNEQSVNMYIIKIEDKYSAVQMTERSTIFQYSAESEFH
jgi:hypothetical protein